MRVFELRDIIRNATAPADAALIDWDPYGSTSSFYGPGALLCWLLVTVSYVTKWAVAGSLLPWGMPGSLWLTSDFVAMLAYPLVAAGDAVIRAAQLPPVDRPHLMATMAAVRSGMNATTITPDVATDMDTLRACVGLAAPLRVCELFLFPGFMILFIVLCDERVRGKPRWRSPLLWADMAFIATWAGLVVATIVVAAVGTPGAVGNYVGHAFISQIMAYVIVFATPGMPIYAGWHIVDMIRMGILPLSLDLADVFVAFLWLAMFITMVCLLITPSVIIALVPEVVVYFLSLSVPDSGVALGELDQAAAGCVGAITLGITLYEVSGDIPPVAKFVHKCKLRLGLLREEREEEMPLTGEAEESGLQQPLGADIV
jgi:hypothetical protein